jgi:hypothetical protein
MSETISTPEQGNSTVVSLSAGETCDLTPRREDDPRRIDMSVIRRIVCVSGKGELSIADSNIIELSEGVATDVPATQCTLTAHADGPGIEISYSDRPIS